MPEKLEIIVSVGGFITALWQLFYFSKDLYYKSKFKRLILLIFSLLMVFSTSYLYITERIENKKIASISRQADKLLEGHALRFQPLQFSASALAFLEKNKSVFPDAYNAAQKACQNYGFYGPIGDQNEQLSRDNDLEEIMYGLVRGIGTLSH